MLFFGHTEKLCFLTYDINEADADNMALASNDKSELKKSSIDALAIWAEQNELEVNRHKTKFVIIRRG